MAVERLAERSGERQNAHLRLKVGSATHSHGESAVAAQRGGGREARLLSLLQRGEQRAGLANVDDRRRDDEGQIGQALAQVVDDHLELQLAHRADDVLPRFLRRGPAEALPSGRRECCCRSR